MSLRAGLSAGATLLYMVVIFVLSSRPPPTAVLEMGVADTWLHLVEYAVLGALLADAAGAFTGRWTWRVLIPIPALLASLYGLGDEWHQSFVPGRDSSLRDVAMDVVGAILGSALYALVVARFVAPTDTAPSPTRSDR